MRFSEKAQSIIEYAVVIILVAAGIILMKPYVIRGINAHMKSWEDSTTSSLKEPIKTVPVTQVPSVSCDCTGNNWKNGVGCCVSCDNGSHVVCGDGFCCAEGGETRSTDPNFCPRDCGGVSCARLGVTEEVCAGRNAGNCCFDNCCSRCRDAGGTYLRCIPGRRQCDIQCPTCGNGACESALGEDLATCCLDCSTPFDGFCCDSLRGGTESRQNTTDCCKGILCNQDYVCDPVCGENLTTCPDDTDCCNPSPCHVPPPGPRPDCNNHDCDVSGCWDHAGREECTKCVNLQTQFWGCTSWTGQKTITQLQPCRPHPC